MKIYIYILIIGALLGGCARPHCITDSNEQLTIRWGVYYSESGRMEGYQINTSGEIRRMDAPYSEPIAKAGEDELCRAIDKCYNAFLKSQAFYVPADTQRVVMMENPTTGVRSRAFWNPEFTTDGNKYFVDLYDYLMDILNDNQQSK
ncbi:MAG: hypothetical protein ACLFQX_02535 [Candidatus Kapaibacterium sp.]